MNNFFYYNKQMQEKDIFADIIGSLKKNIKKLMKIKI